MRSSPFSMVAILLLSLATNTAFAKGSNIGIYAVVDQVTFDQDGASPNVIRISGIFVVPVPMSSDSYAAPQRGYLYFRVAPGEERAARTDWNSLKLVAGTGRVVGFASYWAPDPKDPNGHRALEVRVRTKGDVGPPDVYPVIHPDGVVEAGDQDPHFDGEVAARLQELMYLGDDKGNDDRLQLFVQRDQVETLGEYQTILEANPRSSLANYRIAELLFSQRNYQASANCYRFALQGDGVPRWTEVWSHIGLGKIFDITAQRDRAMKEYRLAVQTKDNTLDAVSQAEQLLQKPYEWPKTQ
jgi:tetratricopeptide (TPR) repeat protein